jgi:flavin-binding protein dodecin
VESDHVYKSIELTGSSTTSVDDAVRNAVSKASKSLHNLRWFEVKEIRGGIDNAAVSHWQVTMKVGFTLDG